MQKMTKKSTTLKPFEITSDRTLLRRGDVYALAGAKYDALYLVVDVDKKENSISLIELDGYRGPCMCKMCSELCPDKGSEVNVDDVSIVPPPFLTSAPFYIVERGYPVPEAR